jgi:hypothetical protein
MSVTTLASPAPPAPTCSNPLSQNMASAAAAPRLPHPLPAAPWSLHARVWQGSLALTAALDSRVLAAPTSTATSLVPRLVSCVLRIRAPLRQAVYRACVLRGIAVQAAAACAPPVVLAPSKLTGVAYLATPVRQARSPLSPPKRLALHAQATGRRQLPAPTSRTAHAARGSSPRSSRLYQDPKT